jgi:Holliday junction DNA helicase RuvA
MISGLRGVVQRFGASRVYLLSGSVEYEVHVPLNVFEYLQQKKDTEHFLHIYHLFTSEEQRLYGFLQFSQRELFGAILSLRGFGSVLALSVLSHLDLNGLLDLCERNDVAALSRIPRIGKKTAESLVFEVNQNRDRFRRLLDAEEKKLKRLAADEEIELAGQALLQLGYRPAQIQKVLTLVRREVPAAKAAELIRLSLRHL